MLYALYNLNSRLCIICILSTGFSRKHDFNLCSVWNYYLLWICFLIIIALFLMWLRYLFSTQCFVATSSFSRIQLWPHGLACQATLPMGVSPGKSGTEWIAIFSPGIFDQGSDSVSGISLYCQVSSLPLVPPACQAPQREQRCSCLPWILYPSSLNSFFISSHWDLSGWYVSLGEKKRKTKRRLLSSSV